MPDLNAFVSPEYPVLHTLVPRERGVGTEHPGFASLSLALLVGGIPSFIATVPIPSGEADGVVRSLEGGDVRVAVVGMSVDGSDLPDDQVAEPEPWESAREEAGRLPGAFLSLICSDGRRIGVARIVARERSASPEEVARFVLRQIAEGVQIPDLASTG
jgi:hypothetical protein